MHCTDAKGRPEKVALVEALVQVCFPKVTADQFVTTLQTQFNVSLQDCTREEELAFIKFYTLPTDQLRCKKKMPLSYFDQVYDALKNYFQIEPAVKEEKKFITKDGVVDLT
jgi:hypothetical protein